MSFYYKIDANGLLHIMFFLAIFIHQILRKAFWYPAFKTGGNNVARPYSWGRADVAQRVLQTFFSLVFIQFYSF